MIQVIDLLESIGVKPKLSGKNVSSGWVEISCPFCNDNSEHCGISLHKQGFNCWVCGEKGSIFKLIMKIENCHYYQAKEIIEKFSDDIIYQDKEITPLSIGIDTNIIPKEASSTLPALHYQYLIERNFDPIQIQKDYKIMACNTVGNYAYRIIIPIIMNDITVNFTSRDVTGKQCSKYKNCDNDHTIIKTKETIYNIDTVKDKIIICEGPTDVWRIGKGSVATMGVEYTTTQLAILAQKEAKEIFILYDSDAIAKAEKLASAVSTFCPKVEILELENGDPGEISIEDVIKLRKEIRI